jgi:hypothetical protein
MNRGCSSRLINSSSNRHRVSLAEWLSSGFITKYRTLSLGTVKELRNSTAHLLSERGGGDEKETLRIKFTVVDSFAPGTVVVMTPGEVLADAHDEEFQVGTQ